MINKLDKGATDRPHLADIIGEHFSRKCQKCNCKNDVHVNSVYAKQGSIIGAAYSIGLAVILGVIYFFTLQSENGGLGSILIFTVLMVVLICAVIHKHETDNVKNFNAYKM